MGSRTTGRWYLALAQPETCVKGSNFLSQAITKPYSHKEVQKRFDLMLLQFLTKCNKQSSKEQGNESFGHLYDICTSRHWHVWFPNCRSVIELQSISSNDLIPNYVIRRNSTSLADPLLPSKNLQRFITACPKCYSKHGAYQGLRNRNIIHSTSMKLDIKAKWCLWVSNSCDRILF